MTKKVRVGASRGSRWEIKWHVDDGVPIVIFMDNDHPYRGLDFIKVSYQQDKAVLTGHYKVPTPFFYSRDKKNLATFDRPAGTAVLDYLDNKNVDAYAKLK